MESQVCYAWDDVDAARQLRRRAACRAARGGDGDVANAAQPVTPGDVAVLHKNSLVWAMVAEAGEEDAAAEQGDLEGLEVEVDAVLAPCVGPDSP